MEKGVIMAAPRGSKLTVEEVILQFMGNKNSDFDDLKLGDDGKSDSSPENNYSDREFDHDDSF